MCRVYASITFAICFTETADGFRINTNFRTPVHNLYKLPLQYVNKYIRNKGSPVCGLDKKGYDVPMCIAEYSEDKVPTTTIIIIQNLYSAMTSLGCYKHVGKIVSRKQ